MKCLNLKKKIGYTSLVPRRRPNQKPVPKPAYVRLEGRPRQTVSYTISTRIQTNFHPKRDLTNHPSSISLISPAHTPKPTWPALPKWPRPNFKPSINLKRWFSFLIRYVMNSTLNRGRNYYHEDNVLPLNCRAHERRRMIIASLSSKLA